MGSSQNKFPSDKEVSKDVVAPVDVINIMLEFADYGEVKGHASAPLVPTLFNSIKSQKSARLKTLLKAIVSGNLDEVKRMIDKDPSLLVEKLEEKDFVVALSGQRSNNGTAYRAALAVEDTQMAAMIKAKLIEVAGEDVANAQYHEQFPKRWEADEAKRWKPLFVQLNTLTDVIKDAKGDITSSGEPKYKLTVREGSAVALALAQFRSLLDARLNDIVTTGRHFNPKLLLQAFKIYEDRYEDFGNDWNDPRAMLFWQRVIGTIQRGLPVNYIQAFCNHPGITAKKLRNNEPQGRSLEIELTDTVTRALVYSDFYPFVGSRLGLDHAIYGSGAACAGKRGAAGPDGSGGRGIHFRSLCQSKTACMQTFAPQRQNVNCLVM